MINIDQNIFSDPILNFARKQITSFWAGRLIRLLSQAIVQTYHLIFKWGINDPSEGVRKNQIKARKFLKLKDDNKDLEKRIQRAEKLYIQECAALNNRRRQCLEQSVVLLKLRVGFFISFLDSLRGQEIVLEGECDSFLFAAQQLISFLDQKSSLLVVHGESDIKQFTTDEMNQHTKEIFFHIVIFYEKHVKKLAHVFKKQSPEYKQFIEFSKLLVEQYQKQKGIHNVFSSDPYLSILQFHEAKAKKALLDLKQQSSGMR